MDQPPRFEDEHPEAATILGKLAHNPDRQVVIWHFTADGRGYEKFSEHSRWVPMPQEKPPGRNDPCVCGKTKDGKAVKYKHCCGARH